MSDPLGCLVLTKLRFPLFQLEQCKRFYGHDLRFGQDLLELYFLREQVGFAGIDLLQLRFGLLLLLLALHGLIDITRLASRHQLGEPLEGSQLAVLRLAIEVLAGAAVVTYTERRLFVSDWPGFILVVALL